MKEIPTVKFWLRESSLMYPSHLQAADSSTTEHWESISLHRFRRKGTNTQLRFNKPSFQVNESHLQAEVSIIQKDWTKPDGASSGGNLSCSSLTRKIISSVLWRYLQAEILYTWERENWSMRTFSEEEILLNNPDSTGHPLRTLKPLASKSPLYEGDLNEEAEETHLKRTLFTNSRPLSYLSCIMKSPASRIPLYFRV